MKRPLIGYVISYIIGILWGLYLNKISIAFFVPVIILIYKVNNTKKIISKLNLYICIIFLFVGLINIKYNLYRYDNLYSDVENKDIDIIATVVSDKDEKNYYDAYKIKVDNVISNGKIDTKYKNTKLILYVPKNKVLQYGNQIKIKGKYKSAQGQRNYKGFDYGRYLSSQKIYGTVELTQNNIEIIKTNNLNYVFLVSNKFKQKIETNLNKIFSQKEAEILIGMLIGKTTNTSEEVEKQFKESSLTHLLAVSGSNISYIIVAVIYLFSKLRINKRISYSLAIAFIIFFIILTGMSSSVVRAGIMGIVMLTSKIFFRKLDVYTSLAFSLLLILFINSLAIFDVGLQLSFAGTLGIVMFYTKILNVFNKFKLDNCKIRNTIFETLSVTISAQMAILPIMAYNFNNINLVGIISNLFAVPISGVITVYGFVVSFVSLISIEISKVISIILYILLSILIFISKIFSQISFFKFIVVTPNFIEIFAYYVVACSAFYMPNKLLKLAYKTYFVIKNNLKAILILIMLVVCIINVFPRNLKINFIDVGQGDSTLIITPYNKRILIDGGGSTNYDVGENVLLPYILDRRIKRIDYVIVSHFDSDHCKRIIYDFRKHKGK